MVLHFIRKNILHRCNEILISNRMYDIFCEVYISNFGYFLGLEASRHVGCLKKCMCKPEGFVEILNMTRGSQYDIRQKVNWGIPSMEILFKHMNQSMSFGWHWKKQRKFMIKATTSLIKICWIFFTLSHISSIVTLNTLLGDLWIYIFILCVNVKRMWEHPLVVTSGTRSGGLF